MTGLQIASRLQAIATFIDQAVMVGTDEAEQLRALAKECAFDKRLKHDKAEKGKR